MTAITASQTFPGQGTGHSGTSIVAWLIARIKEGRFNAARRPRSGQLSDALLSDLGISRTQAEFGNASLWR